MVRDLEEPEPLSAQRLQGREFEVAPGREVIDARGKKVALVAQLEEAALQVPRLACDLEGVETLGVRHLPPTLWCTREEAKRLFRVLGWTRVCRSLTFRRQRDQVQAAKLLEADNHLFLVVQMPDQGHLVEVHDAHRPSLSRSCASRSCACLPFASLERTTAARSASPR